MSPHRLVLVLGGTRSGKSELAERLAAAPGRPVHYLATAPAGPDGDHARIVAHQQRRPSDWETVELAGTHDPAGAVRAAGTATVLLDGLGAWLAGLLHAAELLDDDGRQPDPAEAIDGAAALASAQHAVAALVDAATDRDGLTLVVGEEAGMAPIAADRGTRRWVDLVGTAHQALAARADRVLLVVAGRAIDLPHALADPSAGTSATPHEGDREGDRPRRTQPAATDRPAPKAVTSSAAERISVEPVAPDEPASPAPDPAAAAAPATDGRASAAGAAAPDHPGGDEPIPEPRLHGDRMVPAGTVDFAVNVVQGEPPGWARNALQLGLDAAGRYPDDRPAAAALAARHGRPAGGVLPLGGAVEGFWRLALAVRPRRAAVLVPGFSEAEAALRAVGAEIVHVPREAKANWVLDPAAVPEECDFVAIGRPENPTGVLDPREAILRLRRPGRTVLVDEAFADFVPDEADALADRHDGDEGPGELVVLRSLTKSLSVPGLRCGYLLGEPELVARVRDAGPPWTCPSPSLELLRAYAERPDACARIAARTAAHRDDLVARLRQLAGVQVWDGAANFVLVRVPDGVDAVGGLHRHGIAVRPCASFATLDERYVRIAVRTPALHARLATSLAAVISTAEREG